VAQYSDDEQEIRDLVKQWAVAANKQDVQTVLGFYAADATLVWPGMPARKGTQEIRAELVAMLQPGVTLKFDPERITVAQGGDMASEFGAFTYADANNPTHDAVTKYVVVWRKIGGQWKVLYDCYNANK
jgi:uncharacterized protein (TIGR02246 family)